MATSLNYMTPIWGLFFAQLLVLTLHLWQYRTMESTTKTPVQIAIAEFGGVRALARAIHRDPASVSKWQKGDGTIPTSIQRKLLETAWDRGIELSAYDVIFGRE